MIDITLMGKRGVWRYLHFGLLLAVLVTSGAQPAVAETSKSTNYQATEMQLGGSSTTESCSTEYCAKASIGDMVAGRSISTGTTANFGSVTDSEPLLEVIVDPGASDLGELTTERTATKTMIVRVRTYLSNGYVLQVIGDAPKFNGHTLKTSTTPVSSMMGTEQFGINAAANTTPAIGAAAAQVPSGETSFGVVGDTYKVPNQFKYVSGDVVASSNKESGRTDYTISMIVNVSNTTPAGHYSGDFAAVVVPVY